MIRTQIQLSEEQSRRLKTLARAEEVSVAELIRRSVDSYLQTRYEPSRQVLRERALAIVGKYDSGTGDIGVEHDQYLEEAYGDMDS